MRSMMLLEAYLDFKYFGLGLLPSSGKMRKQVIEWRVEEEIPADCVFTI